MEEVNSKEILEVLNKIKDSKEFSEKIQTKILELKDAPSEEKAKKIFLKELSSTAKKLGYNLSEADFENYFKSKEGELSDDALAQASGGKNNFWSWLAVGAGTLAGGIGMLASGLGGSLGGLFGGGSGGNTDTRPQSSYTQNIDRNRGKSVSDNVFKNTGEEKKSDKQTRSPDLNGGQGYGRYNSSSRLRSTPKKITSKYKSSKIKTSPSINLTKTKDATNAKTAEKKKEKKDNKAVIDVKKAIANKKEENKKKPGVKVVKVVDKNKVEAEKNLKDLQTEFKTKMDALEKGIDAFLKAVEEALKKEDGLKRDATVENFVTVYEQAKSSILGMEAQCKTLGVKPEERVKDELEKWKKLEGAVKAKREDAAKKFEEKIKKLDEAITKKLEKEKKKADEALKEISENYENAEQENEEAVKALQNVCENAVNELNKIKTEWIDKSGGLADWYKTMSNGMPEDKVTKKIETEEKYFESLSKKYVVKDKKENIVLIKEIEKKVDKEQNIEEGLYNQNENENKNNQLNVDEVKNNKEEDNPQEVQLFKEEDKQLEVENPQDQKEKEEEKNEININQVKEDNEIIEIIKEKNEKEGYNQINIVKEKNDNKNELQKEQVQEGENQQLEEKDQDKINMIQLEEDNEIIGEKKENKKKIIIAKQEEDDEDMGLEALFNETGSCEYLKNEIEKQTKKVKNASKDLGDLEKAKVYQQEALKAKKQITEFKAILDKLTNEAEKKEELSEYYNEKSKTIYDHVRIASEKVDELSIKNLDELYKKVNEKKNDVAKVVPLNDDVKNYNNVKAYTEENRKLKTALEELKKALDKWEVQAGETKNVDKKKEFEDFYKDQLGVFENHKEDIDKLTKSIVNPMVKTYTEAYNKIDKSKIEAKQQIDIDIANIDKSPETDFEKMKAKKEVYEEYNRKLEQLKKESEKNEELMKKLKNDFGIDMSGEEHNMNMTTVLQKLSKKIEEISKNISDLDTDMQNELTKLKSAAEEKLKELGTKDKGAGKNLEDLKEKYGALIKYLEDNPELKKDDEGYQKASKEYVDALKLAKNSLEEIRKAIENYGKAELAVNKNNNESNSMHQTLKVKGTDVFEKLRGGNKEIEISLYKKNKKTLGEKHKETEEQQKNFENAVKIIENKMKNEKEFQKQEGNLMGEIKGLDQLAKNVENAIAEEKKIADEVSETSKSSQYNEIIKNKAKDTTTAAQLKKDLEDDDGKVKKNAETIESLRKQFFEKYKKNIIEPLKAEEENKENAAKKAESKLGNVKEIETAQKAYVEWGSVLNKLNTAYATLISRAQEAGNKSEEKLAKDRQGVVDTKLKQAAEKKNELQKKLKKKTLEELIKENGAYDKAKKAYEKDKNKNKIIEYQDKLKEVVNAINECEKAGVEFNEEESKTNSNIKKAFEELKNTQPAQLANDEIDKKYTEKAVELSSELDKVKLDGKTYEDYYKAYRSLENIYTKYEEMLSEIDKENGINDAESVKELARKVCSQNFSKIINYVVNGLEALSKDEVLSSAADGNGLDLAIITQNRTKTAFDNIVKLLSDKNGILVKAENEFLKYDIEGKFKNNPEENRLTVITKIQELRNTLQEISKKFTDNKDLDKQKKSGGDILKKLKKGRSDSFSVEEFETLVKAKSKIELKEFKPDENFDAALEKIFYDSILKKNKVNKSNMQSIKLAFSLMYNDLNVMNSLANFTRVLTDEDKKEALNVAKEASILGEGKKSEKGYKFAKAVEEYVTQQVNDWKK